MEKQTASPWLVAFRILFTVALLACIVFIFRNSLQNAAHSSALSRMVTQKLNAVLAHAGLGPLAEHTVRKLAHVAEFTMLGFLLMMCLRVYTRRFVRHISWPLLGGVTVALTDETLQYFSPGRTPNVSDVWVDMVGVSAGLCVALLLLLLLRLLGFTLRVEQENRRLRAENQAYQAAEHQRLAHRAVQRARQASAPAPGADAQTGEEGELQ